MNKVKQLAVIGLMSAILCIVGPLTLVLPFSPIPLSLCTLAIYFIVYTFGMRIGLISTTIYILIGCVGLPVFSGFMGGVGRILGPTGGYLLGYLLLALIFGLFADKWSTNKWMCLCGMVLGTLACYFVGTLWLSFQTSVSFLTAFATGVLPFIPFDCVKMVFALFASIHIRKRLQKANLI